MLKKSILGILILLISLLGYLGYKYYFTNNSTLNSIHLVPRNTMYFVASDTPIKNWKKVRDSDIWQHLQTNAYFSELTATANTLDSVLEDNKKLFDLLGSKKVLVSAHPISKHDYDFLFIVDLDKTAKLLQFKTVLKSLINKNYTISERVYKEIEIIEMFDKKTRETLYFSVINNNLIASYTHTLVEASINQINESTIGRDLKFIEINQHIKNDDLFRVFVQYNYIDEFAKIMMNVSEKWITDLSKSLVFSGFDMDLENGNRIVAEGYTNTNENSLSYLEAFENAGLGKQDIAKVAPHRTSLYLSLGFDNFTEFYNNYKQLSEKNPTQYKAVESATKNIEDLLDINIQKHFIDWIDNEIALLKLEPMSAVNNTDFAVVLKAKNAISANENLNFILKQIKKKTPVKFKAIDYKGYSIKFMSVKGFFKVFLGGYFKKLDKPYYTIIDDFVIFSNHPNTLKYIITNYKEKNTLEKASNYSDFKSHFDSKSNVFIYMNTPMLFHSVLESVDTETKKQLEKNKTYLTSFTQLGIQLSPEKEVFKSKLVIQYQDQESILYSDEFKPPTVGPLLESEDKKKPPTPLIIDNSERDLIEISEINPKDLDESKYLEYYKNGELKIKAYLKDGVLHGSYREYYDNGELKIKGHFKQGKRSGRWKKYDNKGKTIVSVKY